MRLSMWVAGMLAGYGSPFDDGVSLQWDAPADCPDATLILDDASLLAGHPIQRGGGAVRVSAHVTPTDAEKYVLRLSIEGPSGRTQQSISADRCDTLARVTSLHIALAVEPLLAEREIDEARRPAPAVLEDAPRPAEHIEERSPRSAPDRPIAEKTQPPKARRGENAAPGSTSSASRSAPVQATIYAHGSGTVGLLPGFSPGVGLGAGVRIRQLELEIGGQYMFGRLATADVEPPAGGRLRAGSATLRTCWVWMQRRWELPICGELDVGAIEARGVGVEQPSTQRGPWVAAGPSVGLAVVAHRTVAFFADVAASFSLVRPGFAIAGLGSVYRAPHVAGRLTAGVQVRIP